MFKYHEVSRDPLFKVLVPICVLEVGLRLPLSIPGNKYWVGTTCFIFLTILAPQLGSRKFPEAQFPVYASTHVPTLENAEDELMYEIKANQQIDNFTASSSQSNSFFISLFFLIAAQFCNFWSFVARPWSKLLQRTSQLSASQTDRKIDR